MKYRSKPKVIEAMQWDGTKDSAFEIVNTFEGLEIIDGFTLIDGKEWLDIKTLEGVSRASKYDYIVKGIKNEFYPIREDIFLEGYEAVE